MAGAAGVKKMAVQRGLKVVPFTARHMEGGAAVSIWGALSLLRDVLTSVLRMVGAVVAIMRAAHMLPEESLVSAFSMAVANGAHTPCALSLLKAIQVFALRMVEVAVVSTPSVQRGPKGALSFAKHMEAGKGAPIQGVQREPRGVPHFAKGMVVARGVLSQVAAVRVSMVGPSSVLPMEVVSAVQWLGAPNLQGGGQIFVYGMEVESAARLRVVVRVPKGALIFARRMVGGKDVHGVMLVLGWVNQVHLVIGLQGVKLVFVQHTQPCWMIQGFMVVIQLLLLFRVVLL
jgi:hypothetical protein